jgi:TonB family protein
LALGCFLSVATSANAATAEDEAAAYLDEVEERIMAVWKLPPKSDRLKVTLRYTLARNGSVSFVHVEQFSGNATFADSAVQAVRRASPLPPPPKSFPTGDLRMVLNPTLRLPQRPIPQNQKAI